MNPRGVILARQSRTRDGSESLPAQVQSGRATAERFGIDVVKELVEPPSTSGSKDRGRKRKHFQELVDLIASGQADCVIVYKTDRLTRGGGLGWAPLLDAAESAGVDLDRLVVTPQGWVSEFEIGIRATMDREEAKKLSDRSRDLHERLARDGKYGGNGSRPFGFLADGVTHDPAEAELIREAADRKRSGETWHAIASDWRERGVVGPSGKPFRPENLARMVRSPRVAGIRVHRGRAVPAAWEPILDADVVAAVAERDQPGQTWKRTYLLSGIAECGKCGAKMRGARAANGNVVYRCPPKIDGGCSGISIQGADLERVVALEVARHVDTAAVAAAARRRTSGSVDQALVDEIAADEAALEQLARDHYATRILGRGEYLAAKQALDGRLAAARRRQRQAQARQQAAQWAGKGELIRDRWLAMPFDERRQLVASFVEAVVVGPAVRGRNVFDPHRVTPERGGEFRWRR